MKFENLKLWLSLPLVFFQYRRDVNKRYRLKGASECCRYCVAAVFAVALALGFFLYDGDLSQYDVSQLSAFAADAPGPVPVTDTHVDSNP